MVKQLNGERSIMFFKTFFTPTMRARDNAAVLGLLQSFELGYVTDDTIEYNNEKAYLKAVEGCYITGTSGYVDISCNLNANLFVQQKATGLVIKNTDIDCEGETTQSYIAFIDRVEVSNTSIGLESGYAGNTYLRVFFTIDWWDTLLLWNTDLTPALSSISGRVQQAHVCDLMSLSNGYVAPDMQYTNEESEYRVSAYSVRTQRVERYNGFNGTYFMYITSTENPLESTEGWKAPTYTTLKMSSAVLYCANSLFIAPVDQELTVFLNLSNKTPASITYNLNPTNPCQFSDTSIVNVVVSDFPPSQSPSGTLYNSFTIDITKDQGVWYDGDYGGTLSVNDIKFNAIGANSAQGKIPVAPLPTSLLPSTVGNNLYLKLHRPFTDSFLLKDVFTYESYLEHCVPKVDYAPYTKTELYVDSQSVEVKMAWLNTDSNAIADYVMTPNGEYVIDINYRNKDGLSSYAFLTTSACYQNNIAIDDLTVQSTVLKEQVANNEISRQTSTGVQQAVTSLGQIANGIIQMASGNFGTVGSTFANAINTPFQISNSVLDRNDAIASRDLVVAQNERLLRDGEKDVKPISQFNCLIAEPLQIRTHTPINIDSIRERLAIYGYTTNLAPYELFDDIHERMYFRFFLFNNTRINASCLNREQREQIECMFNTGVWLWTAKNSHIEQFGNFKQANILTFTEN